MKLLASVLLSALVLTILGAGVSVYGEPNILSDGSVETTILLTPKFDVDTSEFIDTGEIILDVKFENPPNKFHGIKWVYEDYDYENEIAPDPVEVYEKYEDERRFYIYILDEDGEKLDIDSMTVTSNDDFILPHGITEKYDDRYVVEVLDIDELASFSSSLKAKIETQLRLESPELVGGNDYELILGNTPSNGRITKQYHDDCSCLSCA